MKPEVKTEAVQDKHINARKEAMGAFVISCVEIGCAAPVCYEGSHKKRLCNYHG